MTKFTDTKTERFELRLTVSERAQLARLAQATTNGNESALLRSLLHAANNTPGLAALCVEHSKNEHSV